MLGGQFLTRGVYWLLLVEFEGSTTLLGFEGQKSIFRPLRKSGVLTLLGAKQPCQVASFHLSLSGSKTNSF